MRQRRALRLIGIAFALLAVHLLVQSAAALLVGHRATPVPRRCRVDGGDSRRHVRAGRPEDEDGRALGNPVLASEGRVTAIDGLLATAVLLGIALDLAFGRWWADPAAGLVIVCSAAREALAILRSPPLDTTG